MSEQPNSYSPDTNDVLQYESDPPTIVDVHVRNPVEVRQLPSKSLTITRYELDATTPQQILGRNPRRCMAYVGADGAFFKGTSQAQALNLTQRGLMPAGVAVQLTPMPTMDEVWAMGSGAVNVSVYEYFWSD